MFVAELRVRFDSARPDLVLAIWHVDSDPMVSEDRAFLNDIILLKVDLLDAWLGVVIKHFVNTVARCWSVSGLWVIVDQELVVFLFDFVVLRVLDWRVFNDVILGIVYVVEHDHEFMFVLVLHVLADFLVLTVLLPVQKLLLTELSVTRLLCLGLLKLCLDLRAK